MRGSTVIAVVSNNVTAYLARTRIINMLQKLHERIQGIVAWTIIIIIVASFGLFGVDYYIQSRDSRTVVASVNGEPLAKDLFELQLRREKQQHLSELTSQNAEKKLKEKVRDNLIETFLLKQAATAMGFYIADEQARSVIAAIPQFQSDGHFSQSRFEQALTAAYFTPESFLHQVRAGMLMNQQRFAIMGTAFALSDEIDRFVQLYLQKRSYSVCYIPYQSFEQGLVVDDSVIDTYYKSHVQAFTNPEKIRIAYVVLSLDAIKKHITISEQTQRAYYDANKQSFSVPAQWKVSHILLAVPQDADTTVSDSVKEKADTLYQTLQKSPQKFQDFVRTVSDDKLSLRRQGVLPWITAGTTAWDEALTTLTQSGAISSPIKTERGYEIFQLISYKPPHIKPFEQVAVQIHTELMHDLIQSQFAEKLEKLSDVSYQTPDSLQAAAEALGVPIQISSYFSRKGGAHGITANPKIVQAAFSDDVLVVGNNSEPVQINDETVIVLRVQDRIPAKQLPLADVKMDITKILLHQKASAAAAQYGARLLRQGSNQTLHSEHSLDNIKMICTDIKDSQRDNPDVKDPQANAYAYSLSKYRTAGGFARDNGDFVLVRIQEIKNGNLDSMDKELQAAVTQQIQANYGIMEYQLYLQSLYRHATITKE